MLCLQWFICLGVIIALSILGGWHLYLISVSETTIEFYTNKRDARRLKQEGKVCVYVCVPFFKSLSLLCHSSPCQPSLLLSYSISIRHSNLFFLFASSPSLTPCLPSCLSLSLSLSLPPSLPFPFFFLTTLFIDLYQASETDHVG